MAISKKISILKLVIDLIKVDNKLHKEEISWIEILCSRYQYTQQELLQAHSITLQEAITTLQQLDSVERAQIIDLIEELVQIDNDIDIDEQILLATIRLSLQDNTYKSTQICSSNFSDFAHYNHQLIYLEKSPNATITNAFDKEYGNLARLLKSYKLDFFYYPVVINRLIQSHHIITPSLEFLFPNFSQMDETEKLHLIANLSTVDFTSYIHKLLGKDTENIRFENFLMLKIQSNHTPLGNTTDFICLNCSEEPIASINKLLEAMTFEKDEEIIPYEGCYRTLFEMFSEKSKQNHDLLLIGDMFHLADNCQTQLDIRGSERKTLYTLFLLYRDIGISNQDFSTMSKDTPLGKLTIKIYRYFANEKNNQLVEEAILANEEPNVIINLRDIAKRNSHIGFIKRAFTSITSLKNPENYYPQNIKGELSYRIHLPDTKIRACHHYENTLHSLTSEYFI